MTMGSAMEIKLRYVHKDVSRHGKVRYYFRRAVGMPRFRLPAKPGDADFHNRYSELLLSYQATRSAAGSSRPEPATSPVGCFRWLVIQYLKSPAFKHLNPSTKRQRRWVLETMLEEPTKPGSSVLYGTVSLKSLSTKALRVLRDRKAALPGAANYRVKVLRHLFRWALEEEHVGENIARDLATISAKTKGFHTWTVEEVEQFENRHPVGTKARLALSLLLWTGARRSDVVLLGKQHVRSGWLRFTQTKTRQIVEIPVLPELQKALDASPLGDLTFLMTDHGRPFVAAGFGNKMRQWCNEAGLKQCSAHGLRKAGAVTAAENGATPHQLMAIFGWMSLQEAQRYTEVAKRRKMAGEAMGLLVRKQE